MKGAGRYTQDVGVGEMLEPESSIGRESALSLHSVGSNQHDIDIDTDTDTDIDISPLYLPVLSNSILNHSSELLAQWLESHKHHNV